MESPYQTATLGLAGALAVVSLLVNGAIANVWADLTQGTKSNNTNNTGGNGLATDLQPFGLDAIFIIVIVFIAGLNEDAGKLSIAVVAGAWLLFLMRNKTFIGWANAQQHEQSTPSKHP